MTGLVPATAVDDAEARADIGSLVSVLLPTARGQLEQAGSFAPLAAAVARDGACALIDADWVADGARGDPPFVRAALGVPHTPEPWPDRIQMLRRHLIKAARGGQFRAAAIAYDAVFEHPDLNRRSDAICLVIDHRADLAWTWVIPYTLRRTLLAVHRRWNVRLQLAVTMPTEGDLFPRA